MSAPKPSGAGSCAGLVRLVILAMVIGGVAAMHSLGHLAAHEHHETGAMPVGVAVSMAAGSAAAGTDADSAVRGAGRVRADTEDPGRCHRGPVPGCPGHGFDVTSVCVAVLTIAMALMVGWLRRRLTALVVALRWPAPTRVAGRGRGSPRRRTPSPAQLSVLRI